MSFKDRVVVLIDMDCFYCQVEEKLDPTLHGQPIAVVQYNAWRGGGIIAVNYVAREKGVTRHMRGDEAKKKCPDIILVKVPTVREKADLTKYRNAGKLVAQVLLEFTSALERASIDEAYMDITAEVNSRLENLTTQITTEHLPHTYVVGAETRDFLYSIYNGDSLNAENHLKLAMGGVIVEKIRQTVFEKTGFQCSAGIAHNKILAKLACGINKPNKQTILSQDAVLGLYKTLPLRKIRSLGGKFGNLLSERLGVSTMAELASFSERDLQQRFDEKNGTWLYNIARGIDNDPVTVRLTSKSIGCCKKFPGRTALKTAEEVRHWISELSDELYDRLENDTAENNRQARQLVVHFSQEINRKDVPASRSRDLPSCDANKIKEIALDVIKSNCELSDGSFRIKYLGFSAGKFEEQQKYRDIASFFKPTARESAEVSVSNIDEDSTDASSFFEPSARENAEVSVSNADEDPIDVDEIENDAIVSDFVQPERSYKRRKPPDDSFFLSYFKKLKETPIENTVDVITEYIPQTNNEDTKICTECNKMISLSEYLCHMDYHIAVNLQKEMKYVTPVMPTVKPVTKSKSVKRKQPETKHNSITAFFTKTNRADLTETCPECGKRLARNELAGHLDYHTARKLHSELNPVMIAKK